MAIFIPSTGAEAWKPLLADPDLHWRDGRSAKTLAHSWEAARGLPPEIATMLREGSAEPELLIAVPEHKVSLPGSSRGASQNDVFALVRVGDRTIAMTIEGKVDEPFGPMIGEWLVRASPGKLKRLNYLCQILGLNVDELPSDLHYQLLHRTASAIIEAKRFKTDAAIMIVHSFSPTARWFNSFEKFVSLYGQTAQKGVLSSIGSTSKPPVFVGWAAGDPRFLRQTLASDVIVGRPRKGQCSSP
jgi:hypothetical protein